MRRKSLKERNIQKKVFADEFVKDLNATEAAKRAHYGEKSAKYTGHRLKNDPEVRAEIQKNMDERAKRTKIDADYVIYGIVEVIERCKQGEPVRDKEGNETGEWKFDANGALRGYEFLGDHLQLRKPQAPVNINLNFGEMSDAEIDAQIQAYEKRLKK